MDAEDLRFFHKTFSENSKISENFIFLHKNGLKDFEKMMVFRRSHAENDPINRIDPNGKFPKNIDEAGECIFGNPKGIIENNQRNITRNQAEIASLQSQLETSDICKNTTALQKRIKHLQAIDEILKTTTNQINQKCSNFYQGGL